MIPYEFIFDEMGETGSNSMYHSGEGSESCKGKGRRSGCHTLFIKMMKSIRGKAIFLLVVFSAACIAFEHRWYIAGAIILIAGALSLLRGKVLW